MDSRVKQSKIILKNYFIFFPGKYISLSTRKIFSWILLSNIRKKKSKNDELSVKISLLLIMLPRRSFRERERGIHRYNDVIWRSKYRNYTISFLTTREFKGRIESPTILSSIQSIYIFQTSTIDLLFVHRTSSHLYRSIPSISRKLVRTNYPIHLSFEQLSRTKYKWIQSYSSWRKVSIDGDLEVDLKKWLIE